jgi:lysophospholipase L1-like esterase
MIAGLRSSLVILTVTLALTVFAEEKTGPTEPPAGVIAWNPKLFNQRRIAFWAQRVADQDGIVFLGDSITAGWGDRLAANFSEWKCVNRGIGGDTTVRLLFRLQEDVLDLHPRALVILIGTNDLGIVKRQPKEIGANISELLDRIDRAQPNTPIVLCRVMPRELKKGVFPERLVALNALIEQIAKGRANVVLCDTWSIYATKDGTCLAEEFPDRVHPNDAGYEKWAKALLPILRQIKTLPLREANAPHQ